MKRSTFHFVNGFFVVAAGVIGLSTVITTYQVMSAPVVAGPTITSVEGGILSSSGYVQKVTTDWKSGFMKALGYAVVRPQSQSIKINIAAKNPQLRGMTNTAVEYAFVAKVTDFSDTPVSFSIGNKALKDAAGIATVWSSDSSYTIPLTPAMQNKWLSIYGFVRNGDGKGAATGLPQQIDDVAAMIFQMPATLGDATTTPAVTASLVSVSVPTAWTGAPNMDFPAKLNQVVGYFQLTSMSDQPVEIKKIKVALVGNGPYSGSVALVRTPLAVGVASDWTLLGTGDPSIATVTSTIGLGYGMLKPTAGGLTGQTIEYPMAKNIILPPKGSMVVAITADNVTGFTPTVQGQVNQMLGFQVVGVAARIAGATADAQMDAAVSMKAPVTQIFTATKVSAALDMTSPGGASTKGFESKVAVFNLLNAMNSNNATAFVSGVHLDFAGTAGKQIRVYKGTPIQANLLGENSMKASGADVAFNKLVAIEAGSSQQLTVIADTSAMGSNSTMKVGMSSITLTLPTASGPNQSVTQGVSVSGKTITF